MWRPFWLAEGAAEYVRKLGRNADTKTVSEKDGFTVDDLLTIVPSATYQDTDPPTAFRLQSYRLLRVVLQENPEALREFVKALGREDGNEAKLGMSVEELSKKFAGYAETAAKLPPVAAAVKSQPAEPPYLAIHRGDVLVAAERTSDAPRYYNGDTPAARGARAIMTRFTRMPAEAMQQLARAAHDLPDHGLVQYHYGAMESDAAKDREPQTAALESAVKLLPSFGRAYAELARLYVLSGKDKDALPLLERALELEPEFADHYYDIRANALVGLGRPEEAVRAINIAEALPHADRKTTEAYMLKVAAVKKKIETKRREADSARETLIRRDVERKVNELEPVVPPQPPAPIPGGQINFEIASTSTIDVVDTVYPDYPEDMRKLGKAGRISLRVTVGPDGKVRNAVVSNSQLPQLNSATVDAAMKWTFKVPPRPRPAPVTITLTFTYALQ
jgi:protein TonB